ncbi:MAG: choice-of-anchor J domain-containing protein, partial [Atribacterota bacterium]|nr:choice-of-anchor J domain-containing protein [Atribacterota bacterium]
VIFFPNTDRTAWTGSGSFQDSQSLCCASYLEITSGACEEEACIRIPIIIDSEPPYATIEVCLSDCTCDGCELSFTSTTTSLDCAENTANCGDSCSGLAGWSLALYEKYPFDDCCETPCAEPVFTCSGTDCPIECTTGCLTEDLYYALVTLVDHTGNEVSFGTKIEIDPEDCSSLVLSDLEAGDCLDTPWNSGFVVCEEMIYCYELPFEEDFDGESLTTIPDGWTTDRPSNWFIVDSTLAGGFSPEMRFSWTPTFSSGSSRLISPCIDAKEASGLELSFKHFVNHFITGYILKVQVSADNGNTWVDSPWSIAPTGDIGPATVNVDLSAYDGETILIAWVIDVAPTLIDYWYIDDIIVQ